MSIFHHDNYRTFLKLHLSDPSTKKRGAMSRIAKALSIHPTLVSLVLSGSRDFTPDQVFDLCEYLKLTEQEADFFSLLVQHERAGTKKHKMALEKKMEKLRQESQLISRRFEHERKLQEEERAIFYSSWIYSAIRLFASTKDGGVSIEELVARFDLPRPKLMQLAEFLCSAGLLTLEKQRFRIGTARTYLEFGSPHLTRHHANWRLKALQKSDLITNDELMFTSPVSLSRKDFLRIREALAVELGKISKIIVDSPAEEVACLNIDFFWVDK